jgi:hypothetical protein
MLEEEVYLVEEDVEELIHGTCFYSFSIATSV